MSANPESKSRTGGANGPAAPRRTARLGPLPRATAALALVTLASLLPGSTAQAAFPGRNGKIAFVSDRDGNDEIYTMNSRTDNTLQRLTNSPTPDLEPSFSPDGRLIVFSSIGRDGNEDIYVMNANGTEVKRLTNDSALDLHPSFSPDGRFIVFTSTRDSLNPEEPNLDIYLMSASGAGPVGRLTDNPAIDSEPAFSPTGDAIAFKSTRDGGDNEIYTMRPDGSAQTRLTHNPGADLLPAFSPDGRKIAFTRVLNIINWEIFTMNADGSDQNQFTNDPNVDSDAAYSPDGQWIAYSRTNSDGNAEVYASRVDGSGEQRLTNNAARDFQPDWQPLR